MCRHNYWKDESHLKQRLEKSSKIEGLVRPRSSVQVQIDPYASQSSQSRRYLAVGLILLAVSLLLGTVGVNLFGVGMGLGGPVTRAAHKIAEPVTEASATSPTPVTESGAAPSAVTIDNASVKKMPKDVLDWLKHLERIEKLRKDLGTEEIAGLLSQLAMLQGVGATEEAMKGLLDDGSEGEPVPPSKEIGDEASKQKARWRNLIADFDSLPPPTECIPIRNSYSQCLGETQAMIGEVLDTVRSANDDPKAAVAGLMKMRGKSESRIDIAAKQTDGGVQDICDKYGATKWFSISADVGGGMGNVLSGLGGMIKQ